MKNQPMWQGLEKDIKCVFQGKTRCFNCCIGLVDAATRYDYSCSKTLSRCRCLRYLAYTECTLLEYQDLHVV